MECASSNPRRNQMKGSEGGLLVGIVVALHGVSSFVYYFEFTPRTTTPVSTMTATTSAPSTVTAAKSVTGTSVDSRSDTFITNNVECLIDTGIGRVELLIVSDSTGAPVGGESINAANEYPCANGVEQVLYINNFTVGIDGWLTPVLPSQASYVGWLNFTVIYQGATYQVPTNYDTMGIDCVTLHVPSGNVTSSSFNPPRPCY